MEMDVVDGFEKRAIGYRLTPRSRMHIVERVPQASQLSETEFLGYMINFDC